MASQLRTYFVGNSVTDTINQAGLDALSESGGDDLIWGRHVIPGAPLSWIWEHPNNGFLQQPYGYYPSALGNYQWDALSLQPFDRSVLGGQGNPQQGDLQMASNFINLARQNSPNLQVYLYQRWPRKSSRNPNPTAADWDALWQATYGVETSGNNNESRSYFERLQTRLQEAFPDLKPIWLVPVGEVLFQLNQKMQSGQVPGYSSIWDLYVDNIHLNNIGSYIVGATYYATLFGGDLTKLPIPVQYSLNRPEQSRPIPISPELESIIEQTVQSVVGVAAPPIASVTEGQAGVRPPTVAPELPAVSIVDVAAIEGRDSTAAITVSLSKAGTQPITIRYSTADGTAQAGSDYAPISGTIAFAPGQTTQTIALPILNDNVPEADETLTLTLSNANNGAILDAEATVTISDTLAATVSTTLPKAMESLRLMGTTPISGIGNARNNAITGNAGNNRLLGKAGRDVLAGEAGADRLLGQSGMDTLIGGAGNDILTGGRQSDRFWFGAGVPFAEIGLDRVTDFVSKRDRIGLSQPTFSRLQSDIGRGFQSKSEFAIVNSDRAAAQQSALIVYNSRNGSLFYNENGSTAGFGEGGKFALLQGSPTLRVRDFVIQG
ncbi:hypothetical protein NDI45_14835 [Leptolyngbya sp. GB1-A1]|uniref:Calx-beta domain-containing protein n=1 Tax=Leptolyngbya sp. GB1-A1 TaxID=2933908 RepID=UPI003297E262